MALFTNVPPRNTIDNPNAQRDYYEANHSPEAIARKVQMSVAGSDPVSTGLDVSGLSSLMKLYASFEESSAQTAFNNQVKLNQMANSFTASQNDLAWMRNQQSADKAMRFSADQARLDREFQQSSADKAMRFNADQAQINRDWQTEMSNTAYQRAMKDMQAAGLNPILAYTQGGAAVTSGSSASGVSASGARASGVSASAPSGSGVGSSAVKANIASIIGSVLSQNASLIATMVGKDTADANRTMQWSLGTMNSGIRLLDSLIPG